MSQPPTIPVSVVMPAYNEEGAIAAAVEDVRAHLFSILPGAELVVVNDGSKDGTGAILDRLAASEPRLKVIHQKNGGHGRALRTGLDAAQGEFVFLIDSDRQIPLEAFPPLWEAAKSRDGAWGVRVKRHDPRLRLWLTKVIRATLPLLFGVRLRDANVPYKIIRRSIWLEARDLIPPDTLAPSLFLALFARRCGYDIVEQEVPHAERRTGVVSIRRWKLFKFCAKAFRQMLAFRGRLARYSAGGGRSGKTAR
ncbi:MAG: glycosyltransferase family 2 protein [Planctomycetota bacterium]|nr:glycosyltransferase family 2 protein [Planctomycetota bacterium]